MNATTRNSKVNFIGSIANAVLRDLYVRKGKVQLINATESNVDAKLCYSGDMEEVE